MKTRMATSLAILFIFLVLCVTGVLSFLTEYSRRIATIHSIFGGLFMFAALLHLRNNFKSIKSYSANVIALPVLLLFSIFLYSSYEELMPAKKIMDWSARNKVSVGKIENAKEYEYFELNIDNSIQLDIDLLRGKHFWHPQIAIWTEDTLGNYLNTLYVTKATAKGIFAGGRTKDNFKSLDESKDVGLSDYRRVDALPVWSHKRGVIYEDGGYAPTYENPLTDGMTGATPLDNFVLSTSTEEKDVFVLKMEINVAFDDNEYYSEFDFPDDIIFHNGTGQLGQPSIVFKTPIDLHDSLDYYLMKFEGHGHFSSQNGNIYPETKTLTTALEIVERIVVAVKAT